MADVKISALPAASTPLAGTEVLPIVQGGTTDKVSVANLTAGRTVDAAAVVVGAGNVSVPSVTFSGDTNTGIYSPAADTIAFTNGGTERMRINAVGNVGIGTDTPAVYFGATVHAQNLGSGATFRASGSSVIANFFSAEGLAYAAIGTQSNHPFLFNTNDTERARITTGGDLVVGGTVAGAKIHAQVASSGTFQNAYFASNGVDSDYTVRIRTNVTEIANAGVSAALTFATSNTERARITSGGDFLINSTGASGTGRLVVRGVNSTVNNCAAFLNNAGDQELNILTGFELTNGTPQGVAAGTVMTLRSSGAAAGVIAFATGNTERARITSAGDLLVGTTNTGLGNNIGTTIEASGVNNARITVNHSNAGSSNDSNYMQFGYGGNLIGRIVQATTTSVSYTTTSDYRLKENVTPLTGAAARVQALKPSRFNFIADPDRTVDGFIAHEAAEVVPEAVSGEKDAVNEDGTINPQGIDQSKLVPLLTAALQEALTEITALKARVAALEVK